ncbi:MAG: NUDIX domain-containing protein [Candidatus Aenigmarchaeota archaeon]|nr:NUDIX domain-containing protein [Candidatus Aenigmarchaeota archaeon]
MIDKLALLHIKNKKLLVAVEKGKNIFYMPGGKRKIGESDIQALSREIKEELSVDILPETIKYYRTFKAQAHGKPIGTEVKMTCYTGEFKGVPNPSGEIENLLWIASEDIKQATPMGRLVLASLKQETLID